MGDLNFAAGAISSLPTLGAGKNVAQGLLGKNASDKQLIKACKDFESILLGRCLEEMKNSIPDSGLFESGISKQVQDLFWFFLAQDLGSKGGMGLWKEIYQQMSRMTANGPVEALVEQSS